MKPYDVGFVCGRFQTFHKGHEKLIETAKLLCDRVLIFIGSAQECGTERNPFNINTRTKMLREVYGYDNDIMIYALSDMTNENDITPEWGKYLINRVTGQKGKRATRLSAHCNRPLGYARWWR